eukprot:Hpha_TRINITY_DN31204_c0_g1::TRINITY_DN31204_c0_g1_i1::g.2468::m.2468
MSRWREVWQRDLNAVPPVILFLFFANNFVVSIPSQTLTQYIGVEGVNMTSAQQQNYEAFIYMPYALKPLYAVGLEQSGYTGVLTSRGLWFVVANILSGLFFLCKAYWVNTVVAAFFVGFCHSICLSASEFALSASLIDAASRNMKNAGALQGVLTGFRHLGSLAATLVALSIYPCHGGGWTARQVHVLYGVAAVIAALCGMLLRKEGSEDAEEREGLLGHAQEGTEEEEAVKRERRQGVLRLGALVLALEGVLVWISLQHFIQHDKTHLSEKWAWWTGLGLFTAAGVLALAGAVALTDGIPSMLRQYKRFAPPALFLFFLNCVPSAGFQFSFFQTSLFRHGNLHASDPSLAEACWPTYIGLVASGAHVVGSFLYAPMANARDVRWVMFFTVLLSSAASLLSIPEVSITATNQRVQVGSLSVPLFTYAMVTGVIIGLCGQMAMNPRQVIATECCPGKERVLAYATYLSFLDMGQVVGGWIGAPVVQSLDIDYPNYNPGLAKFIWISAGLSLGVCMLGLPFVDVHRARGESPPAETGGEETSGGDSMQTTSKTPDTPASP